MKMKVKNSADYFTKFRNEFKQFFDKYDTMLQGLKHYLFKNWRKTLLLSHSIFTQQMRQKDYK